MTPRLCFGEVMHSRVRPVRNRFRYGVYFLRVPLAALESIRGPLLSVDRWNLFSFHRRDHGPRNGADLLPWIRSLLAAEGLHLADGEVWLHAFPRVLGYVFDPVSFWFCHDRGGALRAVLCEVRNTFGEAHNYLVAHPDQAPIEPHQWLHARKCFQVSPFLAIAGQYRFRFDSTETACLVRIDHGDEHGLLLLTAIRARLHRLDSWSLLRAFLRYPLLTLGVMARIHWQALRLWMKGLPLLTRPLPPTKDTTR